MKIDFKLNLNADDSVAQTVAEMLIGAIFYKEEDCNASIPALEMPYYQRLPDTEDFNAMEVQTNNVVLIDTETQLFATGACLIIEI